jgi:hypothetical protein
VGTSGETMAPTVPWFGQAAQPFSSYSNFAPILKYKTKTILMSINVQTFHGLELIILNNFSHWVHFHFPTEFQL